MFNLNVIMTVYSVKNHIEAKMKQRRNYSKFSCRVAKGFTLAEVLITLVIVGVIAILTIPGLIANTNKTELVTKLKKEQSSLMQAFNLIAMDAGGSIVMDSNFRSTTGDAATDANAMNEFANKMNVVKNCGNATGCLYTSPQKFLGGSNYTANFETAWSNNAGKAILADGTLMVVDIWNASCAGGAACGSVTIDINGVAGPNVRGRDVFRFWITSTGITPMGTLSDGYSCDINSSAYTTSDGCTAKVLTEGAMNY